MSAINKAHKKKNAGEAGTNGGHILGIDSAKRGREVAQRRAGGEDRVQREDGHREIEELPESPHKVCDEI